MVEKSSQIVKKFGLRGRTGQLVSHGGLSPATRTSSDHSRANRSEFSRDTANAAAGKPYPRPRLPEYGGSPASRPATAPVQGAKPGRTHTPATRVSRVVSLGSRLIDP